MAGELMKQCKTHEKFCDEVSDKFPHIEVLSEYKASNTEVLFRCKIHDYTFFKKPILLQHSICGCNKCALDRLHLQKLLSDEEFSIRLEAKNDKVEKIGKYTGAAHKVLVRCKFCGKEWNANPFDLLHGHFCRQCAIANFGKKERKTHEEFLETVKANNAHHESLEFITKYTHIYSPITCRCTKCGYTWEKQASRFIYNNGGTGCPKCHSTRSKGELAAIKFFEENKIQYIEEYSFEGFVGTGGAPLRYDFYIPAKRMLIEIQGKQHYMPVEKFGGNTEYQRRIEHDEMKREFALKHGFALLEIPYISARRQKDVYDALDNAFNKR